MAVKAVAVDEQLVLMRQAIEEGLQEGRTNQAFGVRLTSPQMDALAMHRADEAWRRVQRHHPVMHHTWTGAKPTFLSLYKATWLGGYTKHTLPLVKPAEVSGLSRRQSLRRAMRNIKREQPQLRVLRYAL